MTGAQGGLRWLRRMVRKRLAGGKVRIASHRRWPGRQFVFCVGSTGIFERDPVNIIIPTSC